MFMGDKQSMYKDHMLRINAIQCWITFIINYVTTYKDDKAERDVARQWCLL